MPEEAGRPLAAGRGLEGVNETVRLLLIPGRFQEDTCPITLTDWEILGPRVVPVNVLPEKIIPG
jgi:hypothetical protein